MLKRAIGDLITHGECVLPVSTTATAVGNALLGVVEENRHGPGDIVRVGHPQLREVADNPEVSLPLMVRERLTESRVSGLRGELRQLDTQRSVARWRARRSGGRSVTSWLSPSDTRLLAAIELDHIASPAMPPPPRTTVERPRSERPSTHRALR
ncbi:hypothetical protein ACWC5C_19470 [Streptomyces sp. NPDC001700]